MEETLLCKIKNTLLVILKAREEATAFAVVGAATRWAVTPIESRYGDDEEFWGATVFLPAEDYAHMPAKNRERVEQIINTTLNEIARSEGYNFTRVRVAPQLVEGLSETHADLLRWLLEAWPRELEHVNAPDEEIPF